MMRYSPFSLAAIAVIAQSAAIHSAQAQLPPPAQSQSSQPRVRAVSPSEMQAAAPADDDVLIIVPGEDAPTPTRRQEAAQPASKPSKASVGGISIAGLTDVEAALKIRQTFSPLLDKKIAITDGRDQFLLTRRDFGVYIPAELLVQFARKGNRDVGLNLRLNRDRASEVIGKLAVQLADDGKIRGEKVTVATAGSLARAVAAIEQGQEVRPANASPELTYVALVLSRTAIPVEKPAQTPATGAPAGLPYLIGSFSTPYDAGIKGRTNNLRMAAANVTGTVVQPGAVFSTNKAIGPRNAAAGWREAKMFVSGQVVSGVGAGICQCSTTIYNAALLAGLPIVERHQHMFRVSYAAASRDAAIYWGSKDMKFRNNTSGPIYVRTFLKEGRFHAQLFATQPQDVKASVESSIVSSKGGTHSVAYRTITDGAGTRRERLSRDFYKPHP